MSNYRSKSPIFMENFNAMVDESSLEIPPVSLTYEDFYLVRRISAPVERVYAAWVDARLFRSWIVPMGDVLVDLCHDIRAGGSLHIQFEDKSKISFERPLHCTSIDRNAFLQFSTLKRPACEKMGFSDATYTVAFERICTPGRDEGTVCILLIQYGSGAAYEYAEGCDEHSFWALAIERLNMLVRCSGAA